MLNLDQWTQLCHLTACVGNLRLEVSHLFDLMEFRMHWATPVQMRTAYETLKLDSNDSMGRSEEITSGACNTVTLLRFILSERGRLNEHLL